VEKINKYLKAVLLFIGWWFTGSLVGVLLNVFFGGGSTVALIAIVPAFVYGVYSAYKTIKK